MTPQKIRAAPDPRRGAICAGFDYDPAGDVAAIDLD
jgi:hypothetical protein